MWTHLCAQRLSVWSGLSYCHQVWAGSFKVGLTPNSWPVAVNTVVVVVSPRCTLISPHFCVLTILVGTEGSWKHDAVPVVRHADQSNFFYLNFCIFLQQRCENIPKPLLSSKPESSCLVLHHWSATVFNLILLQWLKGSKVPVQPFWTGLVWTRPKWRAGGAWDIRRGEIS